MATNVINPEEILRKEPFRRTRPSQMVEQGRINRPGGGIDGSIDAGYDPLLFDYYTQADFLREWDVNSHLINSIKYYPNQMIQQGTGENSKYYRKVKTRIAIAWQRRIFTKRIATLTGNNIALSIANAVTGKAKKDALALFREGWVVKNIENSIFECLSANLKVGDGAICFYKSNGKVGTTVFSYEKGDILYPLYESVGHELRAFGRKYHSAETTEDGKVIMKEYLDIWDKSYYSRYEMGSENKWVKIETKAHGFERVPIAYARYGEPCWSNSQSLIDSHEMAMSQLAENNAAYALRILVALGADMEMVSSVDGTPQQINSSDPNAKVAFLEPADSSASFDLQLRTLEQNIMRCSFAVETPEIKSGSDLSSLTVKMMYADAYQKALEDAQFFQQFLDDVVEIFKLGYGTEIGKTAEFVTLKVKAEIIPYIFMSESEVVNSMVQLVGSKVLSRSTATGVAYEMLGYGDIDEVEKVRQEEHDDLVGTMTNVVNNARSQQ